MTGSVASTTATSGCSRSASWTARSPSAALPHTTMSSSSPRRRLRLATMRSLLSARRTPITALPPAQAEAPAIPPAAALHLLLGRGGGLAGGDQVVDERVEVLVDLGLGVADDERMSAVDRIVDLGFIGELG